jgi:putative spermidine/putrescine transport system permease protein
MSALMTPLAFPTLVTGAALLQFFALLRSDATVLHLAIAHTIVCTPYVLRTVAASLEQIRPNIEDAARTLGAGEFACFARVTLPQIGSGMGVGAVFAFITSFDNFPVSLWLSDARHIPLPLTIYNYVERFFDPTIAAVSAVMVAISVLSILVLEGLAGLRSSTVVT